MTVELIPVIELSFPALASDKAGDTPPVPYWQHLEKWNDYGKELLKLFGFQQYQAIRPGVPFFPIFQFTNPNDLKKILDLHFEPLKENGQTIADTCALFGGTVLIINDEVKLVPQCCGTLGDFSDWKRVLENDFKSGYVFMEGHPSPRITKQKHELTIECVDGDELFSPPTDKIISVDIIPLTKAVDKAESDLRKFSTTVDKLSTGYGFTKLSSLLIGSGDNYG